MYKINDTISYVIWLNCEDLLMAQASTWYQPKHKLRQLVSKVVLWYPKPSLLVLLVLLIQQRPTQFYGDVIGSSNRDQPRGDRSMDK